LALFLPDGSSRIPEKNIQSVGGKPLIAHTIDQCSGSGYLDETVVSTDDEAIKRVAEEHGGTVPFLRPAELATDDVPAHLCISHALDWYRSRGESFDIVCMIPVTCPLRSATDIDGAIELLSSSDAESVIGVSEYTTPPQWAVATDERGYLYEYYEPGQLWPDDAPRSQDVKKLLHPNGAIFVTSVSTWEEYESFYTDQTAGYELPPRRGIDIDEPWELELVRALVSADSSQRPPPR
jgi:CMP-N-acetylneuraminic acid synthetase